MSATVVSVVFFRKGRFIASIVIALSVVLPRVSGGSGKHFGIGVGGGYSATGRQGDDPPETVHGGTFGVHLTYGINDSWRISAEGNLDWHVPYVIYVLDEVPVETDPGTDPGADQGIDEEVEERTEVAYVKGPSVNRSISSSIALSVVYIVDVTHVVPFIGLGVTGIRVDELLGETSLTNYELGIRLSVGVDYMLNNYIGLGAVLHSDYLVHGHSYFNTRLEIVARVTFFFGFAMD
ncbi:MAG: outer membrane beta-barrel protein [Proteobacteria bacterium]|nr:outer membrane beta-barrel protein [Pseudomonadota bacterium]